LFDLFRFLSKDESSSKDIAKERLKLVLIHDRANVSPKFLDIIKGDIVKVISNYVEIEEENIDIQLSRIPRGDDNFSSALVANIPIRRVKKIGKNRG